MKKLFYCIFLGAFLLINSVSFAEKMSDTGLIASSARLIPLEDRFQKDSKTQVITDQQTGLKWLEGPNKATSWVSAQNWIKSLGNGWRTPTRINLKTLYIKGAGGGACGNMSKAFHFPKKVWNIWAESRDSSTAWEFSFGKGVDCWENINLPFAHGNRALAVISEK
ncbi:MAG: DUF1566 domain-containing protein [Candidatus Riflebacteria bacterium]|nr:DUF1566 domain-containing protein [Candidatus Riflebacteria bacterium]